MLTLLIILKIFWKDLYFLNIQIVKVRSHLICQLIFFSLAQVWTEYNKKQTSVEVF